MSRILDYVRQHQAEMLRDLQDFVERETPSSDKGRLDAFSEFLAGYAADFGARVETIPVETRGNHLRLSWGDFRKGTPILILGHFDTVWPVGTLQSMPFRNEQGRVSGPGVFDMKGGLVQGLWAIRAFYETTGSDRPIVMLCNSDEEIGSPTSRELIEAAAQASSVALVLEPSANGKLKTARKGVGMFRVEVQGKASHAGLDPFAGISAIDELSRLVLQLHGMTERELGTTVNVGVVAGGTGSNVVAARATAQVDLRVETMAEADRITPRILALQPHNPGASISITGGMNRPPMERTAETARLFGLAQQIASDLGFAIDEIKVGGGSDGNFCAAVGTPVLDGLGAVGGGAHAVDEHLLADEMPKRAALVAELLSRM